MDIMRPDLFGQAGPKPWASAQEHLDRREVMDRLILEHPHATPDEIAELLAIRGLRVPGAVIAQRMLELGQPQASG
jgi:arginine repressor